MTDRDRNGTTARTLRPDRAERLAAALRANLKRRKAQARGRAEASEAEEPAEARRNQLDPDE